jgi:hypothetical protein
MSIVGGRPAVTDVSSGSLTYNYATVAEPTVQGQWGVYSPIAGTTEGEYSSLVSAGGFPVIAFSNTSLSDPKVTIAMGRTTFPATPQDWCITQAPAVSGIFGFHIAGATYKGEPYFGFYTDSTGGTSDMTRLWGLY